MHEGKTIRKFKNNNVLKKEVESLPLALDGFAEKELLSILQNLVQQKSENPPGKEEGAAMYVKDVLERHAIKTELTQVKPGRPNVYARLKGSQPGPTMIYNGHLDVVPAGKETNWTYDPFKGVIKDGKLYGRGSADMKSGVAAMIYAAIMLQRMGNPFSGELILFFNVDEERTNLGMRQFLQEDITADYAIISEPTNLDICTGHRGCARFRLRTRGLAGHTSFVTQPDNAIYKMTKLINALEDLGHNIKQRVDPMLGPASLTVSQITGGTAPNIIPDLCEIEIDRRTLPGEEKEDVEKEIRECMNKVASQHSFDYEFENYLFLMASSIPESDPFVKNLNEVIKSTTSRQGSVAPFNATCEAPFFSVEKEIPTIIFGPGGLEQAHIDDEFVNVDEVVDASKVFIQLVGRLLK